MRLTGTSALFALVVEQHAEHLGRVEDESEVEFGVEAALVGVLRLRSGLSVHVAQESW